MKYIFHEFLSYTKFTHKIICGQNIEHKTNYLKDNKVGFITSPIVIKN